MNGYWRQSFREGRVLRRLLEKAVRGLQLLASGSLDANRAPTQQVIRLIKELGITPLHLVDVGANESQWARHLVGEWPDLRVTSFEPVERFQPLGEVFRIALSDASGLMTMVDDGQGSRLDADGLFKVRVARFDRLGLPARYPSILKVDAENSTARALYGFGNRIDEFEVVVVEMWNDRFGDQFVNQQAEIWKFMLTHGFQNARVIECRWEVGMIPQYDIAFWKRGATDIFDGGEGAAATTQ